MDKEQSKHSLEEYSSHLVFLPEKYLRKLILKYRRRHEGEEGLRFLDVGGGGGSARGTAAGFAYYILELDEGRTGKGIVHGDICNCPQVASSSYDIVYSRNVFEHLREPWLAAKECVRIVKKKGLLMHAAPFAWRYHPVPIDFYRYTHDGLKYLFERTGQVKTIFAGYDITIRRRDSRGKQKGKLDAPPVDELGGWRENWETIFVGTKI